jgi:hypothetical protein
MSFPMFFLPQFSIANSPQINTYSGPEVRLAEAISVPINDFISGQLVTDGSADYSDVMITAVDALNQEYLIDGIERMVVFPAGSFHLYGEFKAGVGLRGQGVGKTIFSPPNVPDDPTGQNRRRCVVRRFPDSNPTNNVFWDFEIDASNIPFSHIATYNQPFFRWKGFDWGFISDCLIYGVKSANTLGTSFGTDVMTRVYYWYCESTNSGRGVTTNGESGPGAGFGITSGSLAANEILEFYYCKAYKCKTAGFYLERALTGEFKPTGHKFVGCEAYDNFIGIDNNACTSMEIIGGRLHHNTHSGYQHGANRTTNYNQGPQGAVLTGVEIDNNGTMGSISHGGVHFGFSINRSSTPVILDNCNIHDNNGGALVAVGDGLTVPSDFLTHGEVPRVLRITNGTRIVNNAGPALALTNPKNNQVNLTSITSSQPAVLEELTIDSSVVIENNNRALPFCEVPDAVVVQLDTTTLTCNATFKSGDAQDHALALRGNYTTQNLNVGGNLTGVKGYTPIVIEHTVTNSNVTANLNTSRPTSLLVTNLFTNPKLVTGALPTLTAGTESNITQDQPIAGLTENYRITATGATVTVDMNALVASGLTYGDRFTFSFYAKTSKVTPVRTTFDNGLIPHAAGVEKQPVVEINNAWTRYSFQGTYITGVDLKMVFTGLAANDTIDLQGLMLLDATIQPSYFDGTVNGGVWGGTENASASSKTVSV